ncbi:hypothetical protein NM688_g2366 [Phlebia brevispora]|uniref:Uncharacterized protein n=1 Tax=Phlebia brevispora TaxID=194682 RepID=A0ACC1T925_9APHY|nr:hypothetical protein NM688_g2366 [Phlebia brevispora]
MKLYSHDTEDPCGTITIPIVASRDQMTSHRVTSKVRALTIVNPTSPESAEEMQQSAVMRHPSFYFEDQLVTFKVENRLFRVHRYFFIRESAIFRDMFLLPSGATREVDGMSDERPVVLPGVTIEEFENLLKFFYFGMMSDRPTDNHSNNAYWIDILSIATRFMFEEVRARAIQRIWFSLTLSIDPVDRLALGLKYNVPRYYLVQSYSQLIRRDEPLTDEEARKLGADTTARLAKARELLRETVYKKQLVEASELQTLGRGVRGTGRYLGRGVGRGVSVVVHSTHTVQEEISIRTVEVSEIIDDVWPETGNS